MKKKLAATLSVVLILGLATLGILAYLTSEDSDVNVMTLGNVSIEQLEYERVVEDGEWVSTGATDKYGYTPDEVQPFTGNDYGETGKPLYPAVFADGVIKWDDRNGSQDASGPTSHQQSWAQIGAPGSNQLFDNSVKNAQDKFVFVKNTGKSDAYVRTWFAFEQGAIESDDFENVIMTNFNTNHWSLQEVATDVVITDKSGASSTYVIWVATYLGPKSNPTGILAPEATSYASLLQVYMKPEATNEDVEKIDGNKNGTYDILVFSQGVQTEGFADAQSALDTAFGTEHPWTEPVKWTNEMTSYSDLAETFKGKSGTVELAEDIDADNIIFFGNGTDVTLDLNGKTIEAENGNQFILGAQQGSKLTLTGDGTVNAGKGFMTNKGDAEITIDGGTYNTTKTTTLNGTAFASLAQNNSKIVINGGTFTTNVDNAALFFATSNARIEINGGFFENTADKTPDLLGIGTNKSNTNRIVITGGTFVNYNPLDDKMCFTGAWPANGEAAFDGPWILIPGDYQVVSETQSNGDIWYSVVPK